MTQNISTSPRPHWSRLWQVPTLLAGLAVFGYGSYALYHSISERAVPFETHIADVRELLDRNDYAQAIQYINTLAAHFVAPQQQAQLEALAGDAYFLAPSNKDNCKGAIEHYRQAQLLGWPKPGMVAEQERIDERWGLCAAALGDYPTAIARLQKAIAADPKLLLVHGRELINAYQHLPKPEVNSALAILEKLSTFPGNVDDQVWALSKRLELLEGQPGLAQALAQAKTAAESIKERDPSGRLLTSIGRAEFSLGQLPAAQTDLLAARKEFVAHNLDDGRAALLLGKIAQASGDYDQAMALYQDVILSHVGSPIYAAGRFGRAEILAFQGHIDDQMDGDYRFAIDQLQGGASGPAGDQGGPPEFLAIDAVREALTTHIQQFQQDDKLQTALHFIQLQRLIHQPETAEVVFREAQIHEQRGDELMAELGDLPPGPAHDAEYQEAIGHYAAAAESYLRHSVLATMEGDVSAASLWKAAGLFDKSGQTPQAISAYQEYIKDYPSDALTPVGVLNIGELYRSLGQFDKAIPYFQRNLTDHPNTTPAYRSSVQLAQCYMAMGEKYYPQAEQTLLGVVQDSQTLEPNAQEFRESIFTLGELYYRSHRWSDAILRLQEAITRYPQDPAIPGVLFRLADSYRNSAVAIADAIAKNPQIAQRDSLEQARHDRLVRAGAIFSQVIATLDDPLHPQPAGQPLDQQYLRYSYLYRADCSYGIEDYSNAVRLYDAAASRYGQSLTAVEAYIQIVNSYLAMKDTAQAAAAAERARWILQRIPDDAFGKSPLALSRSYYEDMLKVARP